MKRFMIISAAALALSAGAALAENEIRCDVPMNQWQSTDALKTQLESQGYDVRGVKTEHGCYEAKALDPNGNRVEVVFDPKTLEEIGRERE